MVESEFIALVNWLERWRLLPVILNLMLVFNSVELSFFVALLLVPEPPVRSLTVIYLGLYTVLAPFYVA